MDKLTREHAIKVLSDLMSPIAPFLNNEGVQEVMVNGPDDVWVEERGVLSRLEIKLSDIEIRSAIEILARLVGKEAKETNRDAIIDARLEGLRIAAALSPVATKGASICIRKHAQNLRTLQDYVDDGSFSAEVRDLLTHAVINRKNILISGGTSSGKAQPLDALVLTPGGFRRMGDLDAGDFVTMPNGAASKITGVFPQGKKEIYQITFHDGRVAECCSDHLWKVWTRTSNWSVERKRKVRSVGWRVVPLKEIIDWFERGRNFVERTAVPVVAPYTIEFPKEDHRVHPYVVGALLGDGNLVDGSVVKISSADKFILERVQELVPGYELRRVSASSVDYRFVQLNRKKPSPIRVDLQKIGLWGRSSADKFIPPEYKSGSVSQRMALIQGLMDTDGYVCKGGYLSYTTISYRLANDVQEVIWSLGGIATITEKKTKFNGTDGQKKNGQPAYMVHINHFSPEHLVSLPRKVQRISKRERDWRLRIVNIEPIGEKECQCISIEDPAGLYVTNNYVVTHNTTFMNAILAIIPDQERVVTIEDTKELQVKVPNHVSFESNEQAGITIRDLVRLSLRYRPDRIIVGEVRGAEAFDLMQAMNTGHDGGFATIHANSASAALSRLESLVLTTPGVDWPLEAIRVQIATTFHYVIQLVRINGRRQLKEVLEINGFDNERRTYVTKSLN